MQFATIKGLRIEKYTLQSQNWRESAKTNKTTRLITARRNIFLCESATTPLQEPNGSWANLYGWSSLPPLTD
jgi:hypothetical protein